MNIYNIETPKAELDIDSTMVEGLIASYINPLMDFYVQMMKYPIELFYGNKVIYSVASEENFSCYCKFIRTYEIGKQKCESDHKQRSHNADGINICHAGVWNYCRKIFVQKRCIASFLYGQKRIKGSEYEEKTLQCFRDVVRLLKLDAEKERELYEILQGVETVERRELEPKSIGVLIEYENKIMDLINKNIILEKEKKELDISVENAVHTINTYLFGIDGIAEYLSLYYTENHPELSETIAALKKNIERFKIFACNLGYNIADYDFKMGNLKQCVLNATEFYGSKAGRKGIELIVKGAFPRIEMSEPHMQLCFYNLVENAIKYSYHGRRYNRYISITGAYQSDYCEIGIENYGIGIEPEEVWKIFTPKYQGKMRQGENRRGSGLGLAIVKGIIEKHLGYIWASSEKPPGSGKAYKTTFHLLLPIKHRMSEYIENEKDCMNGGNE